jgi:hypothetical protein
LSDYACFHSSCFADWIAGNMSAYATTTNNALFASQASAMQAACNGQAVPTPAVSFNPITSVSSC